MSAALPPIQLYNTLTRRVEPFVPQAPGRVKMYTCGPTVYDFGHIGNFRTFVAVDILQRFLAHRGLELDTVMNITDVDDKMIARAQASGVGLRELGDQYAAAFREDAERLGIEPARHIIRATDFIPRMVDWIERLVASGHAYEREGSVYFRLASFAAYGRLSGKDLAGLQAGARVDVDEYVKDEARDFALWKAQREGEPAWPSPWGAGRPGWHIECSVMAETLLGPTLDLHCGGVDLVFPHHENEIAQVEPLTGVPFVRGWFHCEFLLVNGEKMSKSAGNFYTVRDLVEKGYAPRAIRYLLASVPARRQLNFTLEGLDQAASALQRLDNFSARLQEAATGTWGGEAAAQARQKFEAALADDLNTAEALGAIFELVRSGNIALDRGDLSSDGQREALLLLRDFDGIFRVMQGSLSGVALAAGQPPPEVVERRLAERTAARSARDFARSDAIRHELEEQGVLVEDSKQGTRWRYRT